MKKEVIKVEIVTGGTGKPTERRELTGEELKQWKKEHGYDSTENETESDTE